MESTTEKEGTLRECDYVNSNIEETGRNLMQGSANHISSDPVEAKAVVEPSSESDQSSLFRDSGDHAFDQASTKTKNKNGQEQPADQLNPYSYTSRGEFTSENFKIEIRNMPRYYGIGELKKLLTNQLKLNTHKVKPLPGRGAGVYVTLHDEESRRIALEKINGYKWKKVILSARPAAAVPDPLIQQQKKRQHEEQQQHEDSKKQRLQVEERPLHLRIKDAVAAWWNIPYAVQLERKKSWCDDVVADFKRQLRKINYPMFRWLDNHPFQVTLVQPSPVMEHYRNKCEFTVGYHPETNEPVVGFRLASYAKGSAAVAPLDGLPQVSERMRVAAELFQQHVRESSYVPYDAVTHKGHWKQLLVRTSIGGDLLMSVGFHPQDLSEGQLREAQQSLCQFMTEGAGSAAGVTSLHWQSTGPLQSGRQQPHVLLHGAGYVTETLCGLQFRVSPDAFFQVNTAATEVLYETIGDLAGLNRSTTLLDVCCGTGSIGLALAAHAGEVIGVELVESAVADARANADRNNVTNCKFYAGRAETMVRTVLEKAEGASDRKWVAVVDPPRAGLGREVTQALRRAEGIDRVVFVACDLKQALRNLLDLGRPESKQYAGDPFAVRRIVPVDLFPQTPHVEVAVLLERCNPAEWKQTSSSVADASADAGDDKQSAVADATDSSAADVAEKRTEENVDATRVDNATRKELLTTSHCAIEQSSAAIDEANGSSQEQKEKA